MDHSRACHWLCRWGQHGTADPDDCGPTTDCPFPFSRSAGGEPNRNFRIRPPCSRWARQREDDDDRFGGGHREPRSEEHTSELQSLITISYAVFCLKKKKT